MEQLPPARVILEAPIGGEESRFFTDRGYGATVLERVFAETKFGHGRRANRERALHAGRLSIPRSYLSQI